LSTPTASAIAGFDASGWRAPWPFGGTSGGNVTPAGRRSSHRLVSIKVELIALWYACMNVSVRGTPITFDKARTQA
jgi:hypothetical protein